ncbi:histone-like protein 18C [Drosophila pseudoobscura]|uniref:Histone-like protein 18C n=1 Tax=Drosophila pseudoobscura pseudoobscura TaxID=46245 RepID=A0A6I8UXW5_DROPS|nr:histone-like protein 18C [Drosophila pseudoobscura]XP_002132488.2 histone-like protein 18C [Drosophila pseudoobscura]
MSKMSYVNAYLNYLRDCKRRFGSIYHGQRVVHVAAQRWRAMSPGHRARYRGPDYRPASSIGRIKQGNSSSLLCTEQDAIASTTASAVVSTDSSLDEEECFWTRKSEPSCAKSKPKKASCEKRRRKKSDCKKRKSRRSKKSCSKPPRKSRKSRKSNKSKCKKTDDDPQEI